MGAAQATERVVERMELGGGCTDALTVCLRWILPERTHGIQHSGVLSQAHGASNTTPDKSCPASVLVP